MLTFILRRGLMAVVTAVVVSAIVFGLSRAAGDPRMLFLGDHTTKEVWDEWGRQMGLDRPLVVQYTTWLGKMLKGDFGKSLRGDAPILSTIGDSLKVTGRLALSAWIFAIVLGIPLGVLSAVKRGTLWDYLGRSVAMFGQALPPFWLGVMFILVFAVNLRWLPVGRMGGIDHYILPAITLGWLTAAGLLRLMRSAMLEVLDSEFIKFARSKGVRETWIIWKHALKNAIIPPLTYAGMIFATFLMGSVVTESVFAWPGLGRLMVTSVYANDFPVLAGCVMMFTLIYVLANLVVDILYAYIDPRIRYT